MTVKQRTKLELIRIEGICRMLLNKIEEEQLVDLVESITKTSAKDIKKAIFRLPRYQLIEVIELAGTAINDNDIDAAYEQYRYGLKPGFTLFSINQKCKSIGDAAAYKAIAESLSKIPYDEDATIKSITAMCMMKLFSNNSSYRPSPHQAGEFGDVSFTVTHNGNACQLVGIAKSAVKNKEVLTTSETPSREMLQQVLSATHDARVGIIAVICPMRFHDQLVEELRYIAKLTAKPIVILDDMFMVKQYKAYHTSKECR